MSSQASPAGPLLSRCPHPSHQLSDPIAVLSCTAHCMIRAYSQGHRGQEQVGKIPDCSGPRHFSLKCPLPTRSHWERKECAELQEKLQAWQPVSSGVWPEPSQNSPPGRGRRDSVVRAADGPEETLTPFLSLSSFKHSSVHLFIQQTFTSPW